MPQQERFQRFLDQVNLIGIFDSSARGGSVFFSTIFDQHPQIACCPVVQYSYSYLLGHFGGSDFLPATEAHEFVTKVSYFRQVYQPAEGDNLDLLSAMGVASNVELDREKLRSVFDQLLLSNQEHVSRRYIFLAMYFAYLCAMDREPDTVHFVLTSDVVSLASERLAQGYEGGALIAMSEDFPAAKFVILARDPRACFASLRHQYVNKLGNIHGYSFKTFPRILWESLRRDYSYGEGCLFLFWPRYFVESGRTISKLQARLSNEFITVRNEDLNLNFSSTMQTLSRKLEVESIPEWMGDSFAPTIMGKPWKGLGAFNSSYQTNLSGPLANESPEQSKANIGPNRYVTERWKTRLSESEIKYLEGILYDQIYHYGYDFKFCKTPNQRFKYTLLSLFSPFNGELPDKLWLSRVLKNSLREQLEFVFYMLTLPLMAIVNRVSAVLLLALGKFENVELREELAKLD